MRRLAVLFAFGAGWACTDTSLYSNKTRPNFGDRMSLEGDLCTEDPTAVDFPVKTLLVMDGSAFVRDKDPAAARSGAVQALMDRYSGKNRIYGVLQFGEQAHALTTGFAKDIATLATAVDGITVGLGDAQRSYLEALRTASTIVQDDVLSATPGVRSRTRYVIIFATWGPPTPSLREAWCTANNFDPADGECNDRFLETFCPDNGKAGQMTSDCERDRYRAIVEDLRAFVRANGAQDLVFHAVSLTDDMRTNVLVQDFALAGRGEAVRQKEDALNLVRFGMSSAGSRMLLRDVVVYNPVALLRAGKVVPDSDGDGLADEDETLLGTDPLKADTDDDLVGDAIEKSLAAPGLAFDPLIAALPTECSKLKEPAGDDDRDGLSNCEEAVLRTDPSLADSDRDGIPDIVEVRRGGNALVDDRLDDTDQDGVTNGDELKGGLLVTTNNSKDELEYGYRYRTVDQGAKTRLEAQPDDPFPGVRVVGLGAEAIGGVGMLHYEPGPPATLAWSEDTNVPPGKPVDVSKGGYFEIASTGAKTIRINVDKALLANDGPQDFKLLVKTSLRTCFHFDTRNVTLVETLELPGGRPGKGWNPLMVFMGQVPEESPQGHTVYEVASMPVRFLKPDKKTPDTAFITLEQDNFVLLGGQ